MDGGVVPMHHVRRLTTTLVDILRVVAQGQHQRGSQELEAPAALPRQRPHSSSRSGGPSELGWSAEGDLEGAHEGSGLLGIGGGGAPQGQGSGSELCYGDDKLSVSSGATGSSSGAGSVGPHTALLRAAFTRDEYKGESCGGGREV